MPTQSEYNSTLQNTRTLYCKVNLLNEKFQILEEISGIIVSNPSFNIDEGSAIRRTCNFSLYPTDSSFDIKKGNKIWFNRYVQVFIGIKDNQTNTIPYTNMGIYLINSPSRTYNATTNIITIQGSDLMTKLTGERNGSIEAMEYQVEADSNIRNAIIAVLKLGGFENYIIHESKYVVPNLISINVGGSLYDILSELLNIDPTYQMYFDVDGVFHYEPIPSGSNDMVMVDDDLWQRLLIGYTDDFDFSSVKNEIDVLGKTWDKGYYFCETVSENVDITNTLNIVLKNAESQTITDFNEIMFAFSTTKEAQNVKITLGYDKKTEIETTETDGSTTTTTETEFITVFSNILLQDLDKLIDTDRTLVVQCIVDDDDISFHYISDLTPRAIVKCENPTSPFFIGAEYKARQVGITSDILYLNVYEDSTITPYYAQGLIGFNLSTDFYGDRIILRNHIGTKEIAYCHLVGVDGIQKGYNIFKFEYIPSYNDNSTASNKDYASTFNFICIDNDYYMEKSRIVLQGGEYDNICTQSLAEQRARYEYYQYCQLPDSVKLTCVPVYWLDVNWLTTITLPNKQGTEENVKYIIKQISTSYGATDTQNVTLMKYNENNIFIGI